MYEGLSANAAACRVRLSVVCTSSREMVTPWPRPLDHSSYPLLLLLYSFLSPFLHLLRSIFFFEVWPYKRLSKQSIFFHITSDLRHFGATPAIICTQTKPRYASFLSGFVHTMLDKTEKSPHGRGCTFRLKRF